VPQGTLSGPELFIHMVADLQKSVPNVKYVDDTTFAEICEKGKPSELQQTANKIIEWSKSNHLYINTSKTKELTIAFGKKQELLHLIMDGKEIERVSETKLLGVIISDNLKWDAHVKFIGEKDSKRLFLSTPIEICRTTRKRISQSLQSFSETSL
jgi:hypothetical protein